MKSKLTITVASILSVLVGVGFAAWVISNPNVKESQDGTITAEGVEDKSYSLKATIADNDKAIIFGAPETMDKTGAWLTAGTGTKTEDLTAKLTLTLNYKDWAYVPTEFFVTMKAKKDNAEDTVFTGLVSNKYITNPKITYGSTNVAVTMNGNAVKIPKTAFTGFNDTDTTTDKSVSLDITIAFGWGEHFKVGTENVNPYIFYSQEGKTYENSHKDANTVLTAISGLSGVSYVVTIEGTTNVSGK